MVRPSSLSSHSQAEGGAKSSTSPPQAAQDNSSAPLTRNPTAYNLRVAGRLVEERGQAGAEVFRVFWSQPLSTSLGTESRDGGDADLEEGAELARFLPRSQLSTLKLAEHC